ncbi:MAG: hypothetical protein WD063_10610 [Pirellulales bacterium]
MKAIALFLLVALVLAPDNPTRGASAAEPVEAFLEALRGRRFYDEAFDYLEQLRASAHLGAPFQERLLYEQAVTLLASASDTSDPRVRETRLARAAELFEKFYASHPQHLLAASAKNQLAGILVERGRNELREALDTTKDSAAARAREWFEQARGQFAAAEKDLDAQLGTMPKLLAPGEIELKDQKRQLAGDLAQARLLRTSIDYELAKTYEPASAKAKQHFTDAARNYAALYETYRTRAVGLLARLWEGRCYQELAQYTEALGCYQELMDLADADETRTIKTMATRHALECWTNDGVKKYQAAIERGERWEKEAGSGATDADALAIRYLTALACQEQSQSLPDKDPNRKKLVGVARQHVGAVARQPGEYQRPAKTLLVALSGKNAPDGNAPPGKFADAYEQAQQALSRVQGAAAALSAARADTGKAALEKLTKQKDESAAQAMKLLRLALSLSDPKTPLEDLNSARYYLCYVCWDTGNYYEAAVLGEFLARRYPDSLPGRQGARIALAAYVRLYGASDAPDRSFELAKIQQIAEMTFQRWPDQEEAEEAALTLVNFAAAAGQVDKAVGYLARISADSPRRGQAELRAGQALWSSYLRALRLPDEDRPPPEKSQALKQQAQEILTQGIERVGKSGPLDATLASAAFSLAQICVESGDTAKAIFWLEQPKFGPLTLVKAGHPAAAREGFAVETYKMALRAYVSVSPQQLEKAEEAMNALEKLVGGTGDAKAAENLTAIYISLGRQLQDHLKELRKSGNTNELDSVSKAFEVFLDRVVKRDAGGSYASLNWAGETYYSLGAGFDEGGSSASPRAKSYLQKATTAYRRMLEMAQKDPKYKDQPDALVGMRLRLADCLMRGGDFDEAIKTVADVLKDRQMLISAQVQAAEIYQAKGATDPKGYELAILGGQPKRDGTNLIWGWGKISKMTMNNPKFEQTFHQARLNIAAARYQYALAQKDKARRTKVLEAAVGDLWQTYKLLPKLGGPDTTTQYDRTLKKIQKALGKPETGLAEFKQRDAAAAASK